MVYEKLYLREVLQNIRFWCKSVINEYLLVKFTILEQMKNYYILFFKGISEFAVFNFVTLHRLCL